ncbi:trypsin-like serine protease [Scytonema sp. UIC 10036]|uniref:S1 family peptidase n=1 Tax=Scytonema sp. UIC 10036 TaxID=2304196 RepID=UPI0012DAC1F2|nr:serine protease [Scytonema sp. UIC 10036]MUG92687.1 trypsin-like serine protease [Scytonema sp. UIC 10036]
MNWRLTACFACITGAVVGLVIQVQTLGSSKTTFMRVDNPKAITPSHDSVSPPLPQVQPSPNTVPKAQKLQVIARAITVKVLANQGSGSGILIHHQGQKYTVLTNEHVLERGDKYRVVTPDGRVHLASVYPATKFDGNDLALLQFSSDSAVYTVAALGSTSSVQIGEQVFTAGFPQQLEEFIFTVGQVTITTDKALQDGYQLGYTNNIQKGMSGGPVLNSKGEVIAVNGMHAYPLWGDPYTYKDGSKPCQPMRQLMERSAFAIPIETFKRLVKDTNVYNHTSQNVSSRSLLTRLSSTGTNSSTQTSATLPHYVLYPTLQMQQQATAAKSCVK